MHTSEGCYEDKLICPLQENLAHSEDSGHVC